MSHPPILFEGAWYSIAETWSRSHARGNGHALSHHEAVSLLGRLRRDPVASSALQRLYARYGASHSSRDVRHAAADWLMARLRGAPGGSFVILRGQQLPDPTEPPSLVERAQQLEAQRIDGLIAKLGAGDLVHRGSSYRLARAAQQQRIAGRGSYEAISAREAAVVLGEAAQEPQRPVAAREALSELLALLNKPGTLKGMELVLLRRQRTFAISEAKGPALTPSQLRKKETHWIEIEVVDAKEKPLANVTLEVVLPDGSEKTVSTNFAGLVRVEPIPSGSATIRVPGLDGKVWKPLGGAGASPTQKPQPKRVHQFKRGDNLARIAWRNGFEGWKQLWESPKNAALRDQRKRANMVRPGDSVNVEVEVREIVRASDALHRIQVLREEKLPLEWSC